MLDGNAEQFNGREGAGSDFIITLLCFTIMFCRKSQS